MIWLNEQLCNGVYVGQAAAQNEELAEADKTQQTENNWTEYENSLSLVLII